MSALGFVKESIEESTQYRLVVRIRPWFRYEYVLGVPAMWTAALLLLYWGVNMISYWRFLLYFVSFWLAAGSLVFVGDNAEELVYCFDKTKGAW